MKPSRARSWLILLALLAVHTGLIFWPLIAVARKSAFHELEGLVQLVGMFLLFAQPFLLAAWAVFGSEHFAIRLSRAILIFALMNIRFLLDAPHGSDPLGLGEAIADAITEGFLILQACLFLAACVSFTLTRIVLKWRIIPIELWQEVIKGGYSAKFRLFDLFQLTALAAIVFAVGRDCPGTQRLVWHFSDPEAQIQLIWFCVAGCVLAIFLTLPFLLLALAEGARRKFVWPAIMSVIVAYTVLVGAKHIFQEPDAWSEIIALPLSLFGSVFLSLWLVRLAGFRLLRKTDFATKNMLAQA